MIRRGLPVAGTPTLRGVSRRPTAHGQVGRAHGVAANEPRGLMRSGPERPGATLKGPGSQLHSGRTHTGTSVAGEPTLELPIRQIR
jgi:hypothetical protein